MYFIEKEGVYSQGVFWIGESLIEGVHELMLLCNTDTDSYHEWVLKVLDRPELRTPCSHNKNIVSISKITEGKRDYRIHCPKIRTEVGDFTVDRGLDIILSNFNGEMSHNEAK